MVVRLLLAHFGKPRLEPVLPVLVVDHSRFQLFLDERFLCPVLLDLLLYIIHVNFLLEFLHFLQLYFAEDAQERLCCHVEQLAIRRCCDPELSADTGCFIIVLIELELANID